MSCINGPRFAQFVFSNVKIVKNEEYEYTITLCKLKPITLYQIVNTINPDFNDRRVISNINLKSYVDVLVLNNDELTSILAVNGKFYAIVIKSGSAKVLDNCRLRFNVTTKNIKNETKNVSTNLPTGFFKNAVSLVNNIALNPNECPFPSDKKYFNSFVGGNVKISQQDEFNYKIVFKKSSNFTIYQIRNQNDATRLVQNRTTSEWMNQFIYPAKTGPGLTALMRLKNGCTYAFVLSTATFIENVLTFYANIKSIFNTSSTVNNGFKKGDFNDVIFDIDPQGSYNTGQPYFTGVTLKPASNFITNGQYNKKTKIFTFEWISPFNQGSFWNFPYMACYSNAVVGTQPYIAYFPEQKYKSYGGGLNETIYVGDGAGVLYPKNQSTIYIEVDSPVNGGEAYQGSFYINFSNVKEGIFNYDLPPNC